jgi:hypothetical protein
MCSGQEIIIIFHKQQDPKTNQSKRYCEKTKIITNKKINFNYITLMVSMGWPMTIPAILARLEAIIEFQMSFEFLIGFYYD